MRRYLLIGSVALGVGLAGCEPAEDMPPDDPATPQVTQQDEQPDPVTDPTAAQRPDEPPEQALDAFFEAIEQGDHQQASEMVARSTLRVDEDEMRRNMEQFAATFQDLEQPVEVLDAHQMGDYAIAAVRYPLADPNGEQEEIRPAILVSEEGSWRVDWELLGVEPQQAMVMSDLAKQIEPLYDWYTTRAAELERELAFAEE